MGGIELLDSKFSSIFDHLPNISFVVLWLFVFQYMFKTHLTMPVIVSVGINN